MEAILKGYRNEQQEIKYDTYQMSHMEFIEQELFNALSDSKGQVREMCRHILSAGGKRIRPMLVLNSGLIFSERDKRLVQAAVAAELIHMASLVHDDIIDNSDLRRNRPSINKVWGSHFAVLCGDYLFARAFGIMSGNKMFESLDLMVEAIENMCHGEIIQAADRYNPDVSIENYYTRIAMKTAIFLKNCCKCGAVISGADEEQTQYIGEYGLNLGYAYQIIDDILDFCGNVNNMGKPNSEDLRQGTITLPIILLLNSEKHGAWLRELIVQKKFSQENLEKIHHALIQTGIIDKCYNIAGSHIEKSKQSLEALPQTQYTSFLYGMLDKLSTRVS